MEFKYKSPSLFPVWTRTTLTFCLRPPLVFEENKENYTSLEEHEGEYMTKFHFYHAIS